MKEYNPFANYLKSLEKFEFLDASTERQLIEKAQGGNMKARGRLVSANLRFVVNQAKKMAGKGADIEDLVCAGNMGLVKAVDRFDLSKDVRFITFAAYWIHAEMKAELSSSRMIHIPHNSELLFSKVVRMEKELDSSMGTDEKCRIIAGRLGTNENLVKSLFESSRAFLSLDARIDGTEEFCLYECIEDDRTRNPSDVVIENDVMEKFSSVIESLPPDEREVLVKHYGLFGNEKKSLDEISSEWKCRISREGIRIKEKKAFRKFTDGANLKYFEGLYGEAV